MRFGLRLPVVGPFASKNAIESVAKLADSSGFHSVWMQGHFIWTKQRETLAPNVGAVEVVGQNQNPNSFEYLTLAPYVAAITSNVKLAFAVYMMPLLHPVVTAKLMSDLDVLSDGRLIFCVAAGGPLSKPTFDALGVDFDKRREMTDEYIKAVKDIWTKDNCSFEGNFVKFKDLSIYPKPVQKPRPPIWIAGNTYQYVKRAARLGDGIMLTSADPRVMENLPKWSDSIASLRHETPSSERASDKFDFAMDIFACIAGTDEEASRISAATLDKRVRLQASENALETPSLESIKSFNLVGSANTLIEKVAEYERSGVSLLELRFISRSNEEMLSMIKSFAKDVMPSV